MIFNIFNLLGVSGMQVIMGFGFTLYNGIIIFRWRISKSGERHFGSNNIFCYLFILPEACR